MCGIALPAGLRESERLPEPLFTPSTKAEDGPRREHHVRRGGRSSSGGELAERVRDARASRCTARGRRVAEPAGIILADTKFEFGIEPATGELLLIDEVLTPDSSRFWDAATYEPGRAQASFDKQFVRDWLETPGWDKTPPGPELPADVVDGTRARYVEAFERITGGQLRSLPRRRTSSRDERATSGSRSTSRPKAGILDPQGRAVEGSLGHLGIEGVSAVRVGRRVELTVDGRRRGRRRAAVVERLAAELLSNPLIEATRSRSSAAASSTSSGAPA